MEDLKRYFIESCTSLVQSREDLDNQEVMAKHREAIERKRQIVQKLKDNKGLDRVFIIELLNYPHDSVRIQAANALLFELYIERAAAIQTLKQIKKQSTNEVNVRHCDLMLKKQEGYFYSKILIIVTYITLLVIFFLAAYYNNIKKNHEGPMDLWAIILMCSVISILLIIILITRVKNITILDGSDKTNKFGKPLVWLAHLSRVLKRLR